MTIYFFVTDETFCMARISEIVTHCGQQEDRGRICITWTKHQVNYLDNAIEAHIQAIALVTVSL